MAFLLLTFNDLVSCDWLIWIACHYVMNKYNLRRVGKMALETPNVSNPNSSKLIYKPDMNGFVKFTSYIRILLPNFLIKMLSKIFSLMNIHSCHCGTFPCIDCLRSKLARTSPQRMWRCIDNQITACNSLICLRVISSINRTIGSMCLY